MKGINLNKKTVNEMIDEIPIFSILAVFAKGKSSFSGGETLKNKESNRINSLYQGLKSCKIKIIKKKDGLIINGVKKEENIKNATIKTFYDHRIAMVFMIMGLACKKKIKVDNLDCIKTSFPNFLTLMRSIRAKI